MSAMSPATSRRIRFLRRDLGLWPVIIGLVIIAVGFQFANDAFLSSRNLSNMILQTAVLAILTLGVMLVLLLGEIDLSIGAVSGLTAAIMGVLSALAGWPAWAAILSAILLGAAIGLAQGSWIVIFRAPSFIVSLAGMLVWQGLQLLLLTPQSGQLRITDPFITGIASEYLPRPVGWAIAIAIAVGSAGLIMVRRVLTSRAGYPVDARARDVLRIILGAAVPIGIMVILDGYFGVPYLLLIVLAITGILAGRDRVQRFRSAHLCGRRQHRGGSAHRNPCRVAARGDLHARRSARRDRGRLECSTRLLGVGQHGRWQHRTERDRGRGDRRHQPVRRTRHDHRRAARRPGD